MTRFVPRWAGPARISSAMPWSQFGKLHVMLVCDLSSIGWHVCRWQT